MKSKRVIISASLIGFLAGFLCAGYMSCKDKQEKILIRALENEVVEICLEGNESKNSFVKCDNSIVYIGSFLEENDFKKVYEYKVELKEKIAKKNFLDNIKNENNKNKEDA